MTAFANKIRREIQENKKRVKRGIHRPMVMDGDEGKKLKNVVLLRILKISKKKENDGIKENEGVSSPMSKTRSKQGIEDKLGDHSNVSKTIVKQSIERNLGYCANGPI